MSARKIQFIGDEVQFDGILVARLLESSAPPTVMDAAKEFMESGDPDEDEWVSMETHEAIKGERDDALSRAEKAEAKVKGNEDVLDSVVERISQIVSLLTPKDELADPLALGLAGAVADAVKELNNLKESLL
ncbi:hypothetical protein [Oceanibaculum nanhaiense]|uniref:hypothetical protein n=1 Tax=Oceanibaculum nanhaiense TaxID=1909734 RepID=UPI003D2BF879